MINSKKHDKNFSKETQNQQQKQTNNHTDNNTVVYFRSGVPRRTACFKCDEKLWLAFKSEIKRSGLSICHVLEPMIYGWLQGKVYLSNTIRPLKIENLVVERAVKRVRRYAVENVDDDGVKCCFCRRVAVGLFRYKDGSVYPLCRFHAKEMLGSGNWSVVEDE